MVVKKEKLGKAWGEGSNYYKIDPETGKKIFIRTYSQWRCGKSKRCIGDRRVWEDNHSIKSSLTIPYGQDSEGRDLYKKVFVKKKYIGRKIVGSKMRRV